jgi:hypothetical protein
LSKGPLPEKNNKLNGRRSSKIRQPIHILDLAGIAHITAMRTLREFVTQIWHGDVWPILRKQSVNPILAAPAALGAFHPDHVELGRGLSERVGTVGHLRANYP